ncbi:MAG: glycosyltransferase family 4 protein [Candidatus Moranbacteria bacterium]|nr:glycosyltransferase family 4 protein [Candidatus Moranbacteria bacterium]
MKILVVAPTPFFSDRGTHIRILEEALALEKRGAEVTIATYHIGAKLPQHLNTKIDVRRIRRLLFWYKKLEAGPDWQKIILDLMLIKKTFFLARTWKPDIIHGHLHEGALIGFIVQKALFWRKIKLVADFHGSLTKEMASHSYLRASGLMKFFEMIERFIDTLGDAAVASSWDNIARINTARKHDPARILLDGTRLSMFEGQPEASLARAAYRIPQEKVVIVYTGALIANKGIKLLLDAVPIICARYQEAHFVIAGFPVDQITEYVKQAIFKTRVTIISPLSYFELPKILCMSDIGVDPKESDTRQASGKMLQYMGAGLPIACFDTQNNREYLADGGIYAGETTPEGLALAIGELISSRELRQVKGSINRQRAKIFSWEASAEKLEKIYNDIS